MSPNVNVVRSTSGSCVVSFDIPPNSVIVTDRYTEAVMYGEDPKLIGSTDNDPRCGIIQPTLTHFKQQLCSNKKCTSVGFVKLCGHCKQTAYCSRECQKTDWNTGGHKYICANQKMEYNAPAVTTMKWICYNCSSEFNHDCLPGALVGSLRACRECALCIPLVIRHPN